MVKALKGTPQQLKSLAMGAWLHDVGKLAIPDAILFKPGPLTAEERKIMETIVQIGYDIVKRISFLADAAEIVLTHHERWNGSGYPQGLKGTEIPLGAENICGGGHRRCHHLGPPVPLCSPLPGRPD